MTDPNPDTVEPDEITPEDVQVDEPDTDEPEEWTPPDKDAWTKLQEKAKRRDEKLREAQAKIRELEGKPEDSEPSEADTLRTGLIRTEGRAILAAQGITDRKDQAAVLDAIRLDGIEVDEAGDVDADELEKRITSLRRILAPVPAERSRPRVSTRDQGGRNAEPADPDAARYARIMGAR